MAGLKQVGVELVADDAARFESDINKANKSVTNFGRDAAKASGGLGKFGGALAEMAKVAGGMILANLASKGFGALSGAIQGGIADAREANKLFAQTEAVIKSTGNAAGVSAQHITDVATALSAASGKSLFGDSQIQESENLLLTFTNIKGATLDAATAISVDLAQALGGAPKDSAIQLGKALNDPVAGISALTRVGVTFTEEQKAQIKAMQDAGNMAGAQQVILAELNKEFGGSAAAAAAADGGVTQFKDRLGELGESVGAKVLPMLNSLMAWLNSPEVQAGITALVDGLVNGVTKIGEVIGSVVTAFQDGGLAGVFDLVLPKLQEFATNVGTWITEQAPIWGEKLADWATAFGQWVVDAIPGVVEKLGGLWQALVAWEVETLPKWTAELLKFGIAAVSWIADKLPALADNLGQFANKMINWVVDSLPAWGQNLAKLGAEAIKWVLDALPGLAANLGTFAGNLINWILQTSVDVVPKLAEMGLKFVAWVATDVLPALPGALLDILNVILTFIFTLSHDIEPKIAEMATRFWTWVQDDVIPALPGALEAIKTTIGGWVSGALSWASDTAKSIGSAIIDGIKAGVSAGVGALKDAVMGAARAALDAAKHLLGINSPSRVFADQVGAQIPAGIAQGIAANMGVVDAALARLTGGMGANISVSGSGRIAPPASASQMMAASYSTINAPVNYNWSPTYNNASRNPSQDFHIMQALAR